MRTVEEAGATSFPNAAILRIFASWPEAEAEAVAVGPLGVGFLVDDRHAITCAHVVAAALDLAEGSEPQESSLLNVDLPLLPEPTSPADPTAPPDGRTATLAAHIVMWGPSQAPGGPDVAVLRLDSVVPGTGPARLVDVEPERMRGHAGQIVGFPEGRQQGVWHEGALRGLQADGQIQIDRVGAGYRVSRGFSGSPVWDQHLGAVVGMTARAELGEPAAGFMIPVGRLLAAWPPLAALARPRSPFRDLEPFEEAHASAFFGRDADSDRLTQVVGEQRWTTLVGPSGCGKSSLAMAGVTPRRRAAGDAVAVLRPAHHTTPLRGLASVLLDLLEPGRAESEKFARISVVADEIARHGIREVAARVLRVQRASRLLIVVDQFEELLDEEEFAADDIDALADALGTKPPRTVSVLAVLRTDFLGPVLAHPRLGLLAKQRIEALEPMREEQLRDVVTKPVDVIPAVAYEDALVNRILGDVGNAPGILPLLSFTLSQLWADQRRGRLTHEAYDALGGVSGALGKYANETWERYVGAGKADVKAAGNADVKAAGNPDVNGDGSATHNDLEKQAERLLTRLVRTPIGTQTPVRRLTTRAELSDGEWQIAQHLAGARLLVINQSRIHEESGPEGSEPTDVETVELAHEALISSWDRLSSRVKDDRVFLDWRENLQLDMDRWEKAGRPTDLLPTATALDAAKRWLPARSDELRDAQREYVGRGRARHKYLTRRRRTLTAMFCVLLLAVSVTAGVAIDQRQTVVHQRDRATSAQVAGLAQSLGSTDPQLARRLAVAAARLGDTPEAWSALLSVRYQPEKRAVKLPGFNVTTSDLDGGGRVLVAAGGTHVGTWDVDTGRQLGSYEAPTRVRMARMSADGTTVAVSSDAEHTTVLETRGLHPRGRTFPTGGAVISLSPKGTFLVASGMAGDDVLAEVWNTRTGKLMFQRKSDTPLDASFSANEGVLSLTGSSPDGTGRFTWVDLKTGKNLPVPEFDSRSEDRPGPMAFSPDGGHVAMLTDRGLYVAELYHGKVGYYDVRKVPRLNADPLMNGDAVRFSHDGKLVSVGFNLWDGTVPEAPVLTYPTVHSTCDSSTFRFSADDSELRCIGGDGTFHSLDISRLASPGKQTSITVPTAVASQNGSTVAVTGGGDGKVQIWSTAPLAKRTEVTVPQGDHILLSPDGRLLAVQSTADKLQIWDLTTHTRLGTLPGTLRGTSHTVAISPDGTTYATYDEGRKVGTKGYANTLSFYDLRTMKLIRKKTYVLKTSLLSFDTKVAFRPDGKAVTVSPLLGTVAVPSGKVLVPGASGLHIDGYSPDGTTAYTDARNVMTNLAFLDPRTLRPQGQPMNIGNLTADDVPTAHSPDGRLIAAVYDGATPQDQDQSPKANEVKIWDLSARRQLGPSLPGPSEDITLTTFTPDNSTLVTLDLQGTFRTYTISPSRLVHDLCAASGGLTEQEWKTHIPDVPYRRTC